MQRKWEETTSFLSHVGVQLRLLSNSTINVTLWSQQMVTMFVIVTGVYLISDGQLSMGGLIACTMLAGRIMAPFGQVAGLVTSYHNAEIALKSLDDVMATPLERPEGAQFLSRDMFQGEIEFKNVTFAYPGSEIPSRSRRGPTSSRIRFPPSIWFPPSTPRALTESPSCWRAVTPDPGAAACARTPSSSPRSIRRPVMPP